MQTFAHLHVSAILSIGDHPNVRACFDALHCEAIDIGYALGGMDRVDYLRKPVICSDPAAEPAGIL